MSNPESLWNWYNLDSLDQRGKVIAEYIWIDGTGTTTRSKQRTLAHKVNSLEDLPEWNFDGSSTEQAETDNSEVVLRPVAFYPDPFRKGDNVLVLCETFCVDRFTGNVAPANTNFRHFSVPIMEAAADQHPWFGIEQEYTLLAVSYASAVPFSKWPLGWPQGGYPAPQGPYYCGAGASVCFGRVVMDAHYKACLYVGLKIAGTNGEVMPGQWEYQIGPCEGIEIGDHMWMARYLLARVCENFNVGFTIRPKPVPGDWNGTGCHTNYSTEAMRNNGGYDAILAAIKELEKKHDLHISVYGEENHQRLTGRHETASIDKFSYGVAHRGASVRIPYQVSIDKKGYLEDRRPASNVDPYVHCSLIVDTTCLGGKKFGELLSHFNSWKQEREERARK